MHVNIGNPLGVGVDSLSPPPPVLGGMSRANRITRKSGIARNVLSLSSIVYENSTPRRLRVIRRRSALRTMCLQRGGETNPPPPYLSARGIGDHTTSVSAPQAMG